MNPFRYKPKPNTENLKFPTFETRITTNYIEGWATTKNLPRFEMYTYCEVYSGHNEGHNFWIKGIRYNKDKGEFEYLYNGMLRHEWYVDGQIVFADKRDEVRHPEPWPVMPADWKPAEKTREELMAENTSLRQQLEDLRAKMRRVANGLDF